MDSKSRKDLTKYIIRKKKVKEGLSREEVCIVHVVIHCTSMTPYTTCDVCAYTTCDVCAYTTCDVCAYTTCDVCAYTTCDVCAYTTCDVCAYTT